MHKHTLVLQRLLAAQQRKSFARRTAKHKQHARKLYAEPTVQAHCKRCKFMLAYYSKQLNCSVSQIRAAISYYSFEEFNASVATLSMPY
jgi:hypothetical protein